MEQIDSMYIITLLPTLISRELLLPVCLLFVLLPTTRLALPFLLPFSLASFFRGQLPLEGKKHVFKVKVKVLIY